MLQYRNNHPDFKFWLRKVNRKDRLKNGIWFQGTEGYAFVGLYKRSGGTNMTTSFGLVFWDAGNNSTGLNLEIVWNKEQDPKIIEFYKRVIELLGGFKKATETKYRKFLASKDLEKSAFEWLDNEKPKIDALIIEMELQDSFFISDEQFQLLLKKSQLHQNKTKGMLTGVQQEYIIELFEDL